MEFHGQEKIRAAIYALIARLARASLEAKDIPSYLKAHAPALQQTLNAQGFVYYLRDPNGILIPTLAREADRLKPYASTLQEALSCSVKNEIQEVRVLESDGLPRIEALWTPILQDKALAGVLLFWFEPLGEAATTLRSEVLNISATECAFFLKLNAAHSLPEERKHLLAYTHLLEELLEDLSLQSVGWKLVNYAREVVQCTRVCLFIAKGYHAQTALQPPLDEEHFAIQACSGLKNVHPRSEQAVLLQNAAKAFLALSAERGHSKAVLAPVIAKRIPPLGSKPRPDALVYYFEKTPMQWATAMPLYDSQDLLCGILLFEGQNLPENLQLSLLRMHTLARSGGVALAKALYWDKNTSLKSVKALSELKHKVTPAQKRRCLKQSVLILTAAVAFCFTPIPYRIKGEATLTPERQTVFASKRTAIIESIAVKAGQRVSEGDLLYTLDAKPINLALTQAQKSYYRLHAEADKERHQGNEGAMHQTLIQAEEIATRIELLKKELLDTRVYAPYDCVILSQDNLALKKGEVVLPGEPILNVADLSTWIVRAELREHDVVFLQNYLKDKGPTTASLSLLAHPAQRFPLELANEQQLHYGEDPASDNYTYYAAFRLKASENEALEIKEDYIGTVSIKAGWRSLAYTLFHDFWVFIQARSS
jgi:hypothetical protein